MMIIILGLILGSLLLIAGCLIYIAWLLWDIQSGMQVIICEDEAHKEPYHATIETVHRPDQYHR